MCKTSSSPKKLKHHYEILVYFFRAHRTNDLTKKLEKVGPFDCDELEKLCRVSAKCYPIKVPVLYTMAKETFNDVSGSAACFQTIEESSVGDK